MALEREIRDLDDLLTCESVVDTAGRTWRRTVSPSGRVWFERPGYSITADRMWETGRIMRPPDPLAEIETIAELRRQDSVVDRHGRTWSRTAAPVKRNCPMGFQTTSASGQVEFADDGALWRYCRPLRPVT